MRSPSLLLWIIPDDTLRVINLRDLQAFLERQYGCDTWPLDDGHAIAVGHQQLLCHDGAPIDIALHYSITRPLFRGLEPCLIESHDAMHLSIPDSKFWARILLQPNEGEKRYFMFMLSKVETYEPFGFRAFATKRLEASALARIEKFTVEWCHAAREGTVNDEKLTFSTLSCTRYSAEATATSYERDGFTITFDKYLPVTWPWLDLYLRVRRTFRKQERLWFEFFNP